MPTQATTNDRPAVRTRRCAFCTAPLDENNLSAYCDDICRADHYRDDEFPIHEVSIFETDQF